MPIAGVLTADGATTRSPPIASWARIVSRTRSCTGANALMLCAAAPSDTTIAATAATVQARSRPAKSDAEIDRAQLVGEQHGTPDQQRRVHRRSGNVTGARSPHS